MDKELLCLHSDVLRRRTLRPSLNMARHHHLRGVQPNGIVHLLLQRHRGRGCRPLSPRKMPAPNSIGRPLHPHGLHTDGGLLPPFNGCAYGAAARSEESGHGGHRLLLCPQSLLLLQAQAVCHPRRVHRGVRLRAAHPCRRLRLRVGAVQLDCHHDLPPHALHVVRQKKGRRTEDERDGRGSA